MDAASVFRRMRGLISHLRYTVRLLLKSPGFTITAVLILGLGIGTNTAIFSLVYTVVFKSLPFPDSGRLVELTMPFQGVDYTPFDYPDYVEIREAQQDFEGLALYTAEDMSLTGGIETERVTGAFVSASMFGLTALPFVAGRPFTEDEDKLGGAQVVVLNERFWRVHFNADPAVIGKTVTVSGRPLEVIGVAPGQAFEWFPIDLYIPVHLARRVDFQSRDQHVFSCVGRLNRAVRLADAQSEVEGIYRGISKKYSTSNTGYKIRVAPLWGAVTALYAPTVWLLGGAVVCLFLIANTNIVGLLVTRALERRKEIAVRTALGASRTRIFSQLLSESAVISLLGATVGLLVAHWTVEIIRTLSPKDDFVRFGEIGFDPITLTFFAGVTVSAALLFGLVPGWVLTRMNPGGALNYERYVASTIAPQRQWMQSGLVAAQIAFACVLCTAAGLLARSFQITRSIPRGFSPAHVLNARVLLTGSKYGLGSELEQELSLEQKERVVSFYDQLLRQVRGLPGVKAASVNNVPPFTGFVSTPFSLPGVSDFVKPECSTHAISPDYFRTLQIPVLLGRDFSVHDTSDSQRVVIINEAFAQRYFADQSPLGKEIDFGGEIAGYKTMSCTVVGVVGNTSQTYPDEPPAPLFQAYFSYTQTPSNLEVLLLRSWGDPRELAPTVRKLVAAIDSNALTLRVMTLEDSIAEGFKTRRLGVLVVGSLSVGALFLAAIGLYGALAYAVSQRRREIGVRIAVGAQAMRILSLVMQQGFKIVGIGLAFGIVSGLALTRFIGSMLYGVATYDPITLFGVVLALVIAGAAACLLPALRAMRTDPITVLRE
jgi:putative ABC transport system permease protein